MPEAKVKSIDIETVNSFDKLLNELRALESNLPGSKLSNLITFNSAYIVVTSALQEASSNGHFENPKFIEKFTLCFARYYFQIINNSLAGNNNIAVAWANLLTPKTDKPLPNFIYLLMGANAHINHDLSLAMVEMLRNDDTENLLKDIVKVDRILVACGDGILNAFTETKRVPRFIKNRTKYIYLPLVMHVVLYWRIRAWRDYLSIKSSGLTANRAQTKGKAVSIRLLWLGRLLSR